MAHEEESQAASVTCFKDGNRECGPDCIAYLTVAPQGDQEYRMAPMWMRCHLLVNEHRKGKHLVVIAAQLSRLLDSRNPDAPLPPPPVTR